MSHSADENRKGGPLISSGFVCYAEKATTIIVHFPGPNLIERFWSVHVD